MENLVAVSVAARSTGKHSRTLRYWISNGKLPATRGKGGMLVNLDDVRRIAALTGNENGRENKQNTSTERLSMEMSEGLSLSSASVSQKENNISIIIRETLAPFIIDLREAHEEIGHLRTLLDAEYERRQFLEVALEASVANGKRGKDDSPFPATNDAQTGIEKPPAPSTEGLWKRLKKVFTGGW
jgi:DNA-binding transcriptional MerR regulator